MNASEKNSKKHDIEYFCEMLAALRLQAKSLNDDIFYDFLLLVFHEVVFEKENNTRELFDRRSISRHECAMMIETLRSWSKRNA